MHHYLQNKLVQRGALSKKPSKSLLKLFEGGDRSVGDLLDFYCDLCSRIQARVLYSKKPSKSLLKLFEGGDRSVGDLLDFYCDLCSRIQAMLYSAVGSCCMVYVHQLLHCLSSADALLVVSGCIVVHQLLYSLSSAVALIRVTVELSVVLQRNPLKFQNIIEHRKPVNRTREK
ncbi:hypothetical protein F511_32348 [Dorcoceras hygrometricum]|uniref:Uncharacterized protein n=1 Tax=Dorcoceras hygrometricum TaxID=472368 RepID=A0A2Z7D2E3_9LAMI|nr:hypothetical protein F511_32348 [Dorcoceras hygrometricum]